MSKINVENRFKQDIEKGKVSFVVNCHKYNYIGILDDNLEELSNGELKDLKEALAESLINLSTLKAENNGSNSEQSADNEIYISMYMSYIKNKKSDIGKEIKKRKEHEGNKKQQELKYREQRIFDLELEKQCQAQDHELKKMDMLLQIEEMKLLREREQRQAEQDQIDSLKDTLKQS